MVGGTAIPTVCNTVGAKSISSVSPSTVEPAQRPSGCLMMAGIFVRQS